ncbi:MAG: type I methionyl aminopeptidase [Clostridia bacterium]|nr:type I methionyl aminopeptidase [Clostridia bacterium]MBQ7582291.1 type I methionyl aminopeptidase [Lachnospiraceae bacterium]MBR3195871.1 type I methionyl aminopeptidase [Clostridia bacterium]
MITIKNREQIEKMRKAGKLTAEAIEAVHKAIHPGVTTKELDAIAEDYIRSRGGAPSFKGYGGFPGSICASVNEEVVHGIPSDRKLQEGDIIGIDCGVLLDGWQGDSAATFAVGKISADAQNLIDITRQSFYEGLKMCHPGMRLGDIGHAVQSYAESHGCGVVRDLCGHGIGREMHEDPEVPNFGKPGHGLRLVKGLVIAVEPMINLGTWRVRTLNDGWTCVTADGSLSGHYEHTIAITDGEPELLTLL